MFEFMIGIALNNRLATSFVYIVRSVSDATSHMTLSMHPKRRSCVKCFQVTFYGNESLFVSPCEDVLWLRACRLPSKLC